MEARSKWLWAVTVANITVAALLLLIISSIMLALAVLAPEISGWPLYVLSPIGLALSIAGLRFRKGVVSRASRRTASVLNGCALALDLLIIAGLATMFFGSTKERFLVPDGYKGDIFVVYSAQDGDVLNKSRGEVTYRIPADGILRIREPMPIGSTRTEYYYLRQDSSLERIRNFWPTTIHPTPENLANDKDIGVYFPRTGSTTDFAGCSVQYQQFYVGTKAHLLTKYRQNDLGRYVRDHPGACSKPKT
jgi:hypothetical protein